MCQSGLNYVRIDHIPIYAHCNVLLYNYDELIFISCCNAIALCLNCIVFNL